MANISPSLKKKQKFQSLSPLSRMGRKSHTFWAPLTPDTPLGRMILKFRYSTPQVQVQYSPGSGTVLPWFRYSTPLVQVLYSPGEGTVLPRFMYSTPQVQALFLHFLWFLDAPKSKKNLQDLGTSHEPMQVLLSSCKWQANIGWST